MPTDDAPRRAARAKPATAGEYDVIREDNDEEQLELGRVNAGSKTAWSIIVIVLSLLSLSFTVVFLLMLATTLYSLIFFGGGGWLIAAMTFGPLTVGYIGLAICKFIKRPKHCVNFNEVAYGLILIVSLNLVLVSLIQGLILLAIELSFAFSYLQSHR